MTIAEQLRAEPRVAPAAGPRRKLGRRWISLAALVALGGSTGCGSEASESGTSEGASTGPTDALTYFRDVKPILDAKCVQCHQVGAVAPFDFTDPQTVFDLREAVVAAVSSRSMPPWPPAQDCSDYLGDRSLAADQIELIAAWVDGGGELGDPAQEGEPLPAAPTYGLTRTDHTLAMQSPYVPTAEPDDYRCFVIDWPETESSFVTGLNFIAGEPRLVHHGIAYVTGPENADAVTALEAADPEGGYDCFGGPEVPSGWLGVWVPGAVGGDFPIDTGVRVEPGSKVVLQIHYAANPSGWPDQTSIEVSTESQVEREAWIQPWMDPSWFAPEGLTIPAGDPAMSVSSALDPVFFIGNSEPLTVHTAGLHMHLLGSRGRLTVERADGSEECLLDIPDWDFYWQGAYALAEPKELQLGDRIRIECQWDNTAENQPLIDGAPVTPADTVWGEGTLDEMCLGAFYLSK